MTVNYARYVSKMIGALNPLTAVTYRETNNGAYSATLGKNAQSVVDYDCEVNIGPATNKFWNGLAQGGDMHLNLASLDRKTGDVIEFVPRPGGAFIISEVMYKVIEVSPSFTGSEAVLYALLVRK